MESFPENWVMQHLEDVSVFRGVDFFTQDIVQSDHLEKEFFRCMLCGTKGEMKSEKSCLEHCQGRRHQRNYSYLVRQQKAWLEEQLVPDTFVKGKDSIHRSGYSGTQDNYNYDDDDDDHDDVLEYFIPFRRWHFGKWEVGLSCQLCGTAAFPNRFAIVEHCESSRRHLILRNRTLYCGNYHPEITGTTNLLHRMKHLPLHYYRWHMEQELLRYLAAKEASMASLASRRYAWYNVWKTLETLELRYRLSVLECVIWKIHMLQYDQETTFMSLSELEAFLRCQNLDYRTYRMDRRKTSQATAIIMGVIPFLKQVPRITKDIKGRI